MRFTGISDGDSQETAVVKVDASALNPAPETIKILKWSYDVYGGLLHLLWASEIDPPTEFAALSSANIGDFCKQGGLYAVGVENPSGDILFSTTGFGAGDSYDITLEMVKKGVPN